MQKEHALGTDGSSSASIVTVLRCLQHDVEHLTLHTTWIPWHRLGTQQQQSPCFLLPLLPADGERRASHRAVSEAVHGQQPC